MAKLKERRTELLIIKLGRKTESEEPKGAEKNKIWDNKYIEINVKISEENEAQKYGSS